MRVLFMGTPEIAAVCLKALAREQEIAGVFCQPDKPVGRRAVITPPPVKIAASELGLPVFQPEKLRDGEAEKIIRQLNPDLIAVVAYGRILPREILDIPPLGCVNIHASLLPKYRGAAPIQRALLDDVKETGVCAMYMAEELDAGDIISARRVSVSDDDDAASLFVTMSVEGAKLLCSVVSDIENGVTRRTPQNSRLASFAPPIDKREGEFRWRDGAREIFCRVRAFSMWPNAYFVYDAKTVKVLKARFAESAAPEGEILSLDPLTIAARGGALELLEVKPEGSRLMTGSEWAAGRRFKVGDSVLQEV